MPQASVKRLIEADKQKLIELVLDIEKYKDFIPYCLDSKVYERNDKGDKIFIVADLTIGKGIFKDTYKSDVKYNKLNNTIYVTLTEYETKKVFAFYSNGDSVGGYPVYGTSVVDISNADNDNALEMIVQTDEDELTIYQIN